MQSKVTGDGLTTKNVWSTTIVKVLGLTLLLIALLSFDYGSMTISGAVLETPLQLILIALIDTSILSYFVISSRWNGWKEWGAVFLVLYGVSYVLTALESVYLGSMLSASATVNLLVNGAITSSVFCAALVLVLGNSRAVPRGRPSERLVMRGREWAWKVVLAGAAFLVLFILFGFAVYYPLGNALDPLALAQEQRIASSAAVLVFPVEIVRGSLLALLGALAVVALPFSWKKTATIVGLLLAVPVSGEMFLSGSMAFGLQVAHFVEVFGEILVFGLTVVWILNVHSRLSPMGVES